MRLLLVLACACSSSHPVTPDSPPVFDAPPDAFAEVPHRAFPQVAYGGGKLMTSMRLVVITAAGDPLETELGNYCNSLVASTWWSRVTGEYNLGAPRGCVHLVGAAMTSPSTLADAEMTQYIANTTAGSAAPDGQTMYLLLLPPGVQFAGNGNCGYSGYHLPYGTLGDGWGVVMRCQFDYASILESLTIVGSHEVVEAATDPDTASGWGEYPTAAKQWTQNVWLPYGGGYPVEVGDFCISTRAIENGVAYQRVFSNIAAAAGDDPCVPALSLPYYNLTVPQDWYAVAPGATVDIPITGWSNAPTDLWEFSAAAGEASTTPPPIASRTIDAPLVTIAGTPYHTMVTGQTSIMHVTMGAGAASGQWRAFWLYSYRLDAAGADGVDGGDHDHIWRVGVYVP
jgi:hypothetical protein